jgi:hypothetical protein
LCFQAHPNAVKRLGFTSAILVENEMHRQNGSLAHTKAVNWLYIWKDKQG